MKYRKLNEVLIEWNESSFEDPDNIFLKSEDIKESLDRYFVYRLNQSVQIKIFDEHWSELEKYKDKVWINSKHVELDYEGYTVDIFKPGEYKVYIEDIDKVIDMTYMFCDCKQLVSAFIPNSVTSIDAYAFYYCSCLTSVSIGNSVTAIGDWTFASCTGLMSVTLPNPITSIGNYAFYHCRGLASVTIPNSVTTIGDYAFLDCVGLTNVIIPNSVTIIHNFAFLDCKNLKTVYVEDINKFNQITFMGIYADPRCYKAKVIELKK